MSLILQHPPGWESVQIGDISTILTQWRNLTSKEWEPLPLGAVGYPCRFGNNWRRPTTKRAKLSAAWAARGNLFARYVLRRTT